jgi:hypothetical protein
MGGAKTLPNPLNGCLTAARAILINRSFFLQAKFEWKELSCRKANT